MELKGKGMIHTKQLELDSGGSFSVTNITDQVREFVRTTGIKHGQALVYYRHTTGGVWIAEHEPGIIADLEALFERLAPKSGEYLHHMRSVDFNGHAHLRSALLSISATIPILEGELQLGTYQEVLILDDQVEPAARYVILQVTGE